MLLKKMSIVAGMIVLTALIACWLVIKVSSGRHAKLYMQQWSDSGACVINTYVPVYGNSVPGKIVRAFSTNSFFRVYHKDGTLLESTEWVLDVHEDGILDHARWSNDRAIYPTDLGYEGWTLAQCA